MRIRPRQQLLDLWRAHLQTSFRAGEWVWGGRDGRNSVSDAEQLMCLLYPSSELANFGVDPDSIATADDVAAVVAVLGDDIRVGAALVTKIEEFFDTYTDADGEPTFAGGSYFRDAGFGAPTDAQRALEVVDSYSMSLSLCIAALRVLRRLEQYLGKDVRREAEELSERVTALKPRVSDRLTSAMIGLARSFVMHTPPFTSSAGQQVLNLVNQTGAPAKDVIADFSAALGDLRSRALADVRSGHTKDVELRDDKRAFECGWTWGIGSGIDYESDSDITARIATQPGYAINQPYLYFTLVALDGIKDLHSQRTSEPDLFQPHQAELVDSLKRRGDLAQRYWSTIARFGTGRWPLEDLPWRTSDGKQSYYYSLAVTSFLIQDLLENRSTTDLGRTVEVLRRLADHGNVTSRPVPDHAAELLHHPGLTLTLRGSEDLHAGPLIGYYVSDFTTLLLKRSLLAAQLARDVETREQLLSFARSAYKHMQDRAITSGRAKDLWDNLGTDGDTAAPSWFLTERMMECLVVAHTMYSQPPLSSRELEKSAQGKISEADHLLNQEMLQVGDSVNSPRFKDLKEIEQSLNRARELMNKRPHTAEALATDALRRLDVLAFAREDATR
ncbi:SCO2524 family protein [Nocardia sp. NPDC060259]|uniref:SCO2524 family protein n=1 Tax=Nocardia sp. NPDC060259 TaxID=3347088 RepID=UPI003657D461